MSRSRRIFCAATAVAMMATATAATADPRVVTASGAAETAEALSAIENLDVVLLEVSAPVAAEADVTYLDGAGEHSSLEECGFGPLEDAYEVSPLFDDNHLVVQVRLGDPSLHAANVAACEYATDAPSMMRFTVRGCYLALDLSIPTARNLVLNPLPASACGLTP